MLTSHKKDQMLYKKTLLLVLIQFCVVSLMAVPARPGIWKKLTLEDGKTVMAELRGDEFGKYFVDSEGNSYLETVAGLYRKMTGEAVADYGKNVRRAYRNNKLRMRRLALHKTGSARQVYSGKKKGLIILAEFSDNFFQEGHTRELYNDIANKRNYKVNGFRGSVSDYFLAQSGGTFELDFDVVGPVRLPHNTAYYGASEDDELLGYRQQDAHAYEMIVEACKMVDDSVNFADYDWDGDGEADQVFVLYAGHGENDYEDIDKNVIWPHMFYLKSWNVDLSLDGVRINTYACSNEIDRNGVLTGIGTICHEFSHCLGFPDLYDTSYKNKSMGNWDIMDHGSYNGASSNGEGAGFLPAGYSGYERITAGWINPIMLEDEDVTVDSLLPLNEGGQAYIIPNEGHKDEYFVLENRAHRGFDSELPGEGMLITHIDYDETAWENNSVNTGDAHLTIVPADNEKTWYGNAADAWPNGENNYFGNNSVPAADVFHQNLDKTFRLNRAVRDIKRNDDGTVSFTYFADPYTGHPDVTPDESWGDGVLFWETFDKCTGTGGNDNVWSGTMTSSNYEPDLNGWNCTGQYYAADKCARFGTSTTPAILDSPAFGINGKAQLELRASANKADRKLGLKVTAFNIKGEVASANFTLDKGAWKDYTMDIDGVGVIRLRFEADQRLFLDDVKVTSKESTGIVNINMENASAVSQSVYTINGVRLAPGSKLAGGIYIINGKKVVIR